MPEQPVPISPIEGITIEQATADVAVAEFTGKTAPIVTIATSSKSENVIAGSTQALPVTMATASLRDAALRGNPAAQFEVASRFAEGNGVAQDSKQALLWYQRAAAAGFAPAQFRLAGMFERGIGISADRERAMVWYRRAAEQGHVKAMHNLAVLTIGDGTGRSDYAAAARWFKEAADRGLVASQFNLAVLYDSGHGVPQDLREAYKWYAAASKEGDREAGARLDVLKGKLEPSQLKQAQEDYAAWRTRFESTKANQPATASLGN
jgi:localization factor PodJL